MNNDLGTPVLSRHARTRCDEMGVDRARVERILRRPDVTRPATKGCIMAIADFDPEISVVYAINDHGVCVVVTVLYRTYKRYDRATINKV